MWKLLNRVRSWIHRDRLEADLAEEIEIHRAMRQADLERSGASRAEAMHLSRRALGNVTLAREDARELWGWPTLDSIRRDVRYGARMLVRNPGFTTVAVLTLALGIGASTALFSVTDEVLFKPLPVKNPEQLVIFSWTSSPSGWMSGSIAGVQVDPASGSHRSSAFSKLTFTSFQNEARTLSDVVAWAKGIRTLDFQDPGERADGQLVSGNYFAALGVRASLGRLIGPADDRPTAAPVVVISHRYWQRRFGGDPAVIGRTFPLDALLTTIVGITPPGFSGTGALGDAPDFSVPLAMAPRLGRSGFKFAPRMDVSWVWPLRVMGRMKPGVTFDNVRGDLQGVFHATALEGWRSNPRSKNVSRIPEAPQLHVSAGSQGLVESRRSLTRALAILGVVVAIVFVVVCVNLANLLFARAESRRREMAVRLAMGAGRARLIRQLLTECVLTSACAALLGGLLAFWGKDLLLAWMTRVTPDFVLEPRLDLRVLLFSSGVAVLTGILVGLVPAVRATRVNPHLSFQEGSGTTSTRRAGVRQVLLVAQVTLSLVLLVMAGLFIRTLRNLEIADVGFRTDNLLLFEAGAPLAQGTRKDPGIPDYTQFVERISALPGVRSVAHSTYALLGGDLAMPYLTVPGRPREAGEDRTVFYEAVSVGYFETLEMPIVLGRTFAPLDLDRPVVAIVNETLARRFFDGNPIGRHVGITKDSSAPHVPDNELLEIVGVVRDAKYMNVREEAMPTVLTSGRAPISGAYAVRTAVSPMALAGSIRSTAAAISPDITLANFRTQSAQAALTYARERHFALVSSAFGALTLLLTSIGLYGLLSYGVACRTQEIGIRIALGAARSQVIGSVLRESFLLVLLGIAGGLAAASMTTRLIESMLFGLSTIDPMTITVAVLLLMSVALLAGLLPARRAASVDPIVALRWE